MADPNVKGGIVEYISPADKITCTVGATPVVGGQVVTLSANRTVIPATAASRPLGVAMHDGAVGATVTVMLEGVAPLKAAGAIAAGDLVEVSATAGSVQADNATPALGLIVGIALEAISDLAVGRVLLRLK
jgi:hypothetical protein